MYGTHAADCLRWGRGASWPRWPGRIITSETPVGVEPTSKPLCRRSPCRLAPASSCSVSSPGVEPGPRPSQSRVRSATLRGQLLLINAPPRNRTSSGSFEDCHAIRHTRRAGRSKCPPGLDTRPGLEPRILAPSEGPMRSSYSHRDLRSATPSDNQGRRLDSHQHEPVYKTAAFLNRATSAINRKQECKESNPVRRFWRPLALPGAHSVSAPTALRPGAIGVQLLSSVTFQYASLMNFDQLSIRTLWSAYSGFQAGRTGFFGGASSAPAPACGRPSACCRPCRPARSSPSSTHRLATAARRGRSSTPRCPAGRRSIGRRSGHA